MAQRIITVELGDHTYDIPVAPIKRAKAWRKKLRQPLDLILGTIQQAFTLEIAKVDDLLKIGEQLIPALMEAPDTLLDLLLDYAPALKSERAYLDDHAVDEQVVDAFLAVLKVAFPLGRFVAMLGQATPATSTSSPAPSGA
jgi:hypothetical protein